MVFCFLFLINTIADLAANTSERNSSDKETFLLYEV